MKKYLLLLLLIVVNVIFAEDLLLDVMFSNDIHGGIDRYEATFINPNFPPTLGGGASSATYINEVRSKSDKINRDNLLVDAGDFFQGHPVGTMTNGKAVIDYMNMVNYDLSVVGNHEYDILEEELIETYKLAKFPILACNIVKRGTDELVDYVQPYIIVNKLGLKIGIIGVSTTDTEKMSYPENIKNIDVLPVKEEIEKYIKIVRAKNVDLVIVVGHLGLPYEPEPAYKKRYIDETEVEKIRYWGMDAQELVHEVEGIDILFGGHMHKGFAKPWEDPDTHTLVVQGYAYGSSIGHITLKIDRETKTISGYKIPAIREGVLVTVFEDEFIPHKEIGEKILAQQKIAEVGMDEVIGEASIYLSRLGSGPQNLIGNLVCEAMKEFTDADFSFINLGGIRADISAGPITQRDVFDVMPFDNQIVMFEVDGKFLKKIIETRVAGGRHGLRVAGAEVLVNLKRKDFDRVTKLLIGGEPWKADKMYKLATTDFLLQGNAGLALLTQIREDQITRYETNLRDSIVEYIKNNSPVSAVIDKRWKRDDKSKQTKELLEELNK
ncbi:MAG: bifunctional metallophosphatase/5'-nucleotidase [Candidatus Cloacimonetes bacterium]|nr:bifunctional metallophosphatase/5'-nucleotidase [Candidatus Cloacimonadota bacterium]